MEQIKINDIAQEAINIRQEHATPQEEKKEPRFKFTFEFEIYENNILIKKHEISVLEQDEDQALEEAIHSLGLVLESHQSIRYTGKFRKESE